jgi:hypothetical protein
MANMIAVIGHRNRVTVQDIEAAWNRAIEMVERDPDYAVTVADEATGEVLTQVYLSEPVPEPVWSIT